MTSPRTEELHRVIAKKIEENDADGALVYYLQASRKQDARATIEALAFLFGKLTPKQVTWLGSRSDETINRLHLFHDKYKDKFASLEFKHTDAFHAFCFEFSIQLLNRPKQLKSFIDRLDKEEPRTLRYIMRDSLWHVIQKRICMDSSQVIIKELQLGGEMKATPVKQETAQQVTITDTPKPTTKIECDQNIDSYLHFALAQNGLR